jgi:hypothetical protein
MKRRLSVFRSLGSVVLLFGLVIVLFGTQTVQAKIYGDRDKNLFHKDTCSEVKNIKAAYLRLFDSEPEAESRGFYACKKCISPTRQPSLKSKEIKQLSLPIGREKSYVGDRAKKIYHNEWCELILDIPFKDRRSFSSAKLAISQEYLSCKECNPPALFKRNKVKIDIPESESEDELPSADMESSEGEALPDAETE